MKIQSAAAALLLAIASLTSPCKAIADPTTPTPSGGAEIFPSMSGYTPVNPDDYKSELDNPGRPTKLTTYDFTTPDGVQCTFGQPASGSCGGNNLPSVPPATCDPVHGIYRYNSISTSQGVRQWPRADMNCENKAPTGKLLPPFHPLTVYGVTCGVDDKKTTACKDSQGRGFVLSPSWSGWLPHI